MTCDKVSTNVMSQHILGTFGQVAMAVFRPRRVFCAKLILGMDSESWLDMSHATLNIRKSLTFF